MAENESIIAKVQHSKSTQDLSIYQSINPHQGPQRHDRSKPINHSNGRPLADFVLPLCSLDISHQNRGT